MEAPMHFEGVAMNPNEVEVHEIEAPMPLQGKRRAKVDCWFFGLGSLFTWNSVITIADYYGKLFPNYHPSRLINLGFQPFSLTTMAVLAYSRARLNTRKRILTGYAIFFLGILLLIVVDLASTGRGGLGPFVVICAIVCAFGVASALVEGGVMGELSTMCPEFIQSFLSGMALGGVSTSVLRLITKAAFDKFHNGLRTGAMCFLAMASLVEFVCFVLYAIHFPRLPIVQYYRTRATQAQKDATIPARLNNTQLLIQNMDYAFDLWGTYALTLSIFPGFLFENTGKHQMGSWYPLVLTAMFNVLDLVGRNIPQLLQLESRKGLLIAVLSRLIFLPAFYFTAKYGDQGWMMVLTSILGLTNGWLTVCVMIVAPRGYQGSEQRALSNFLVLCLLFGISSGGCFNWLWLTIEHSK